MKHNLIGLLEAHGIEVAGDVESGQVWALELWTSRDGEHKQEWVDVTDWTVADVRNWLGY